MRVTLIGSGNVATHLGAAFKNAGHKIIQVYSRDMQNAALLAYHVKAESIDKLNQINPDTDIFIIAVKDDVVASIAEVLSKYQKLIAHTSGSVDLSSIGAFTAMAGVFYPLQTFSKNKAVDFFNVPVCIEGADKSITGELVALAQTISNNVYRVSSEQRKVLHLAAVFACNFPNYFYGIAQQILEKNNLDFTLLRPLILETAQKVQGSLPGEVQTGPAIRNDANTIAAHLRMLNSEPILRQLYSEISREIVKNKKGD